MNAALHQDDLDIVLPDAALHGDLHVPVNARGLVLFAHGSGSSHKSVRNRMVADHLQAHGFGTLLFDLLTVSEDEVDDLRFDIPLLSSRLVAVVEWAHGLKGIHALPIGLFGASTGAASALYAAAALPHLVRAVVSRGGRPDLATDILPRVQAPTLLMVGGWDGPVIDMNETALEGLHCDKALVIVPEATHLFEEPGKLEEVARLAVEWFARYLRP